jgi:hypothetical protein
VFHLSWSAGRTLVLVIRDFSVLDYLAPYDVLIGRDIPREGRMYMDGGYWSLSALFPEPNGL